MKSDCVTQIKKWVLVSIIVPLLVLFLLFLDVGVFMAEVMAKDLSRGALMEVTCGDPLGPGGYYKLANDLRCPCNGVEPALTIEGPATLDLNGKTIVCEPCSDQCGEGTENFIIGIHVKGERATVKNGTIISCNVGLVVGGVDDLAEDALKGHHKITNVRVLASQEVQYDFNDDGEVKCDYFKGDGIVFESTHNFADGNELLDNQDDGIDLKVGLNVIYKNSSIGNLGRGYKFVGDYNWSIKNQAHLNEDDGIEIDKGAGIWVIGNQAIANGDEGIEVEKKAKDSFIKFNKAIANEKRGIEVREGATGNFIKFNKAIFNDKVDLRDKNEKCDNNTWRWNTFDTSEPAECIQ
jgi:hypothetical protein